MFMHKKAAGITITIYFGYFFQYTVPASNNNLESSGIYIAFFNILCIMFRMILSINGDYYHKRHKNSIVSFAVVTKS
jgi:hypothetical protein